MHKRIDRNITTRNGRLQIDVCVNGKRVRKAVKSNTIKEARTMLSSLRPSFAKIFKNVCAACGDVFFSAYRKSSTRHFCSVACLGSFRKKEAEARNGIPVWMIEIVRTTKKRATKRGVPFDLSASDITEIIERSGFACEVTGIAFDLESAANGTRRPWFPSLDRIDSGLGYTKDNVRLVCVAANLAMNAWGEFVLIEMAQSMLANRKL